MLHPVDRLESTRHTEQTRLDQHAALPVAKIAPDHDVDHAVFVFEGDEGDAGGGLWALATGDEAGDAHRAAVFHAIEIARSTVASGPQLAAQQLDRMRPERMTEPRKVGVQILADRGHAQGDGVFLRRVGEQWQLDLDAGHGPARPMAMPGKAAQGAGFGEQAACALVEFGADAEIGDVDEWRITTRGHDAQCSVFGEAGDLAQAEPDRGLSIGRPGSPCRTLRCGGLIVVLSRRTA